MKLKCKEVVYSIFNEVIKNGLIANLKQIILKKLLRNTRIMRKNIKV